MPAQDSVLVTDSRFQVADLAHTVYFVNSIISACSHLIKRSQSTQTRCRVATVIQWLHFLAATKGTGASEDLLALLLIVFTPSFVILKGKAMTRVGSVKRKEVAEQNTHFFAKSFNVHTSTQSASSLIWVERAAKYATLTTVVCSERILDNLPHLWSQLFPNTLKPRWRR